MNYLKSYIKNITEDHNDTDQEDFFNPEKKEKSSQKIKSWIWIKSFYFRSILSRSFKLWSLVLIFPVALSVFKILICGVLGLCQFDLSDNLEKLWLDFFFTGSLFNINAFRIHSFIFLVILIWNYFNEW